MLRCNMAGSRGRYISSGEVFLICLWSISHYDSFVVTWGVIVGLEGGERVLQTITRMYCTATVLQGVSHPECILPHQILSQCSHLTEQTTTTKSQRAGRNAGALLLSQTLRETADRLEP